MKYYSSSDPVPLKIILLQLRKRRNQFQIKLDGEFLTKGNIGANSYAQVLRSKFERRVEKLNWKLVPRAKIAVTMSFFAWETQAPAIHNLVKYYLDPLQGIVFSDDRQVSYLAANYWRPVERSLTISNKAPSVFIHVERLADYKQKFDLYYELLEIDEFHNFLRNHYGHRKLLGEEEEELNNELQKYLFEYMFSPKDIDTTEQSSDFCTRLREIKIQEFLLRRSQIDKTDRPGGPKSKYKRSKLLQFRDRAPLVIDLGVGDHALRGQSKQRKRRIKANLGKLKTTFRQILVPVELDVCVVPRSAELGKDLDNIMREIAAGVIKNDLLHKNTYLRGFRIYVVNNLLSSSPSGNVSVKLLGPYTISEFRDRQQETFKIAKKWLGKFLWQRFHISI